jgi:hypothetical protein
VITLPGYAIFSFAFLLSLTDLNRLARAKLQAKLWVRPQQSAPQLNPAKHALPVLPHAGVVGDRQYGHRGKAAVQIACRVVTMDQMNRLIEQQSFHFEWVMMKRKTHSQLNAPPV